MRKHNFLKAVALTLCMALFVSGTAFAATPGQALDAKEVNYGTLSRADQNILKSMFNAEEYAAMNEDVVNAVGKDANKLFAHFIKYGVFEGRGPSKSFNVSAYMSSYGDLQKAFGKDIMAYYRHYNNYGKKEKRELVTVEKAEAAGVVIKSVTGATKTVLPPSLQNPSSGASSSSKSSSSPQPAIPGSALNPVQVLKDDTFNGLEMLVSSLYCPDEATITKYESDDETIVTVEDVGESDPGKIYWVSAGTTTIKVTFSDESVATIYVHAATEEETVLENERHSIYNNCTVTANVPNTATADEVKALFTAKLETLSLTLNWVVDHITGFTPGQAGEQTVQAEIVISGTYNGTMVSGTITVAEAITPPVDETAPTLSSGNVNRTSDTAATISFTASEAGSYYIAVVAKDAEEPTIETTGAGTAMLQGSNANIEVTLTAGAKDIYVKAKDAAGNVSGVLKITAEAYVAPLTLTITPNGSAAFTENVEAESQTFTVSAATGDMTGLDILWTLESNTSNFLSLENINAATVSVVFDEDATDIDASETVTLKVTVGTGESAVTKTTTITINAAD